MKQLHNKLLKRSRHYRTWHEHPYHQHHHWLVAVLALLIGAYAIAGAWQVSVGELDRLSFTSTIPYARAQSPSCTHFASPGDSLLSKVSLLKPGNVLCMRDGTYNDSLYITVSGDPGNPITIRAEHDGQVRIDGEFVRKACRLEGVHDVIVEGIICGRANGNVFDVRNSERITVRRVSAHDSSGENTHIFIISGGSKDVLLEDTASYGIGRNNYLIYGGDTERVILRRCYARFKDRPTPKHGPGLHQTYGAKNVLMENCVGTKEDTTEIQNLDGWNIRGSSDTKDTTFLGNVVYDLSSWGHTAYDFSGTSDAVPQTGIWLFENNVSINNNYGFKWWGNDEIILNHMSFVDHDTASIWYADSSNGGNVGKAVLRNSVLMTSNIGIDNSGWIITDGSRFGGLIHEYNNFYGVSTAYIPSPQGEIQSYPGLGEISIDPGFNIAKYGKGAYLMRPPNLKGKGENGSDMGAEVLYRYVDGQLTTEPLWPWPMEDRIMKELGVSVTWEANGGLWKTLDGIYSGNQPTGPICGLNGCEIGETPLSCPKDCPGSTGNQPPRNLRLRYLGPTP